MEMNKEHLCSLNIVTSKSSNCLLSW